MFVEKYVGKRGVTWRARVDLPPDPVSGKRRQKWVTGQTKREVEAEARRLLHAIETGGYIDGGKTPLREFLPQWLESYGRAAWESTTYNRHAGIVRNHIIPVLGHIPLAKLTPLDLTTLYQTKRVSGRMDGKPGGLSTRDIRYMHALIRQALSHAVKWGLVIRNVADAVDPPALKKSEMKVWTAEQVGAFLTCAQHTRYYHAYALAIMTGLRRGEILGLRWQDIDLERGELTVRQALKDVNGTLVFGTPKTHRASRPVALSSAAVALLRQHKSDQNEERLQAGPLWEPHDLVFATEIGRPVHPSNFGRSYRQVIRAADLPYIRLHDLRHTHATMLLTSGVHAKVVSERLGHASTAFTMDAYSHVLPDMQREAVDRLDTLFTMPARTETGT